MSTPRLLLLDLALVGACGTPAEPAPRAPAGSLAPAPAPAPAADLLEDGARPPSPVNVPDAEEGAVPVSVLLEADGTMPRPYRAEQIAAAFSLGTWNRYRIATAGRPTVEQRTEVVAWSPEEVTMEQQVFAEDGQALGPAAPMQATWDELREHAAFPAAGTVLHLAELSLPCGSFACQRYTVHGEANGQPSVSTFWFANDRPGPPVLYTVDTAGERSMTMTLLDWGPR